MQVEFKEKKDGIYPSSDALTDITTGPKS